MTKLSGLTVLSVLVFAPLHARAELPKEVSALARLVGTWKGPGTVAMGKDKAKIEATWQCQRTTGEFGVTCAFHVTGIPGLAAYDETDLFGFEPNTGTYHWFSVTNAGETHDHVARAGDLSKLQFVFSGTQDGKPLKEVIDLEVAKDGHSATGRAETFVAGASTSVLDIRLRK